MTELPEGRITAGKIQADELQIHLGEPTAEKTLTPTESKIDNPNQFRLHLILWWIMFILAMLSVLNLF